MATVNSYTGDMPTPERTSLDAIVSAARDILESEGLAGLTMQAIAQRVGVRAPSLYKRVESRDDLIRLVAEATVRELTERLQDGATVTDFASVFRTYAHQYPVAFQLVMAPGPHLPRPGVDYLLAATEPLLRATTLVAGEEHALDAARTVTAWATGFIGMELAGGFNLGGDVDAAWDYGVARLVAAITA